MDCYSGTFTNNMLNAMLDVNNNNSGLLSFIEHLVYSNTLSIYLHCLLSPSQQPRVSEFGVKPGS